MMDGNSSITAGITSATSINEDSSRRCLVDFVEWWCYKMITTTITITTTTTTTPDSNNNNNNNKKKEKTKKNTTMQELQSRLETALEILMTMETLESEENEEIIEIGLDNTGTSGSQQKQKMLYNDYGRLASRLLIVALSVDAAHLLATIPAFPLLNKEEEITVLHELEELEDLQDLEEQMNLQAEELILLKSRLLRQDANVDVFSITITTKEQSLLSLSRPSPSSPSPPSVRPNAEPDVQLEQHILFQSHYREVLLQIRVCATIARFCQRLQRLVRQQQQEEKMTASTTSTTTPSHFKDHHKHVIQAVEEYEKKIFQLFAATTVEQDDNNDDDDNNNDIDIDTVDGKANNNNNNDDGDDDNGHLPPSPSPPHKLIGFLRKDLYQQRQPQPQPQPQPRGRLQTNAKNTIMESTSYSSMRQLQNTGTANTNTSSLSLSLSLAQRLFQHVGILLYEPNGRWALDTTQRGIRQLLMDWQELVLERPILVQLGYGDGESEFQNHAQRQHQHQQDEAETVGGSNANRKQGTITIELLDESDGSEHDNDVPVLHHNYDDDDDSNDSNTSRKQAFVPIVWVDSSTSDGEEGEEEQHVLSPNQSTSNIITDSNKRIKLESPSKSLSPSTLLLRQQKEHDNDSLTADDDADNETRQLRNMTTLTADEYNAIVKGVQKYGLGRWKMIQYNDPGHRLDQMDPKDIKAAYYDQIKGAVE